MRKINPVIIKGVVLGSCPKCGQPYTGEIDADSKNIVLGCINCSHVGEYIFYWPDELPKVVLRHKSSRMLVGRLKKKTKRRSKYDVLPGQLSFMEGKKY